MGVCGDLGPPAGILVFTVGMGLLTMDGGKASGGPELKNWPPDDGTRLLEAWLKGFFAVSAGLGGERDLGRGFLRTHRWGSTAADSRQAAVSRYRSEGGGSPG